jgi:hypothetical protein
MKEVFETVEAVVNSGLHVRIDTKAIGSFIRQKQNFEIPKWNYKYHFYDGGERTVDYLLVLDSLNFCFWGWRRKQFPSGYYALATSLKEAVQSGVPILDADYLSRITPSQLAKIIDENIPLFRERVEILRELGSVLKERGGAGVIVEEAEGSAERLVKILRDIFPSFRDEAIYGGRKVCFYKRAQIFVADLFGCFGGKRWGEFYDMDKLTAFADYKLPQVLRHLGILKYSQSLAAKIDRKELIKAGSPEEIEIRANTIWAVEMIKGALREEGVFLKAFEIDWILWNMGQDEKFKQRPHHRTLTIFY